MRLRLAKEVSLRRYQLPKDTVTLRLSNGNEIEIPNVAAGLILKLDGETSVKDSIAHGLGCNSVSEKSYDLDDFLIRVSGKKVLPIIRRLVEQKVPVTAV